MDIHGFRDAIVQLMATHPAAREQEKGMLLQGDTAMQAAAVAQMLRRLSATPRLIIELDPTGQDPTLTSDRDIEVVVLRHGADLQPLDEDEIFEVADGQLPGGERAGWRVTPTVDPNWVAAGVAELDRHIERLNVWKRMAHCRDRVFQIAWQHGYPDKDPERHPLTWFNLANGFREEDVEALIALAVGDTYVTGGPVDRVTITREH